MGQEVSLTHARRESELFARGANPGESISSDDLCGCRVLICEESIGTTKAHITSLLLIPVLLLLQLLHISS